MSELRGFGLLIQQLEDGQLVDDLGTKLQELNTKLARQAAARGKAKGELILKLKLSADEGGTVQIDGEITMKEPKPARQRTVLWLAKGDVLATENPRQVKLPLKEVPAARAARAVPHDAETGEVR